jgi:serine/threonine-protein kinase
MIRIRLSRTEWEYDPDSPLGRPGGFGAVFLGRNTEHEQVAIKRLHLEASQAAHRELRIADALIQRPLAHVVPILDYGQDAESDNYFIVMSCAEKSLQDEISRVEVFTDLETVCILREIALGLSEVSDVVHRDLKPANVLYHEGCWKLADFGIARFVEESTSLQTLKGCLSPAYAAPEQWIYEHATSATDVYALGCIAYALLTSEPPFRGPTPEDYQQQHLQASPPPIKETNARLRMLVSNMLRKPPLTRPSLGRIINILDSIVAGNDAAKQGAGFAALAQAGAAAAELAVRADAARIEEQRKWKAREDLAKFAFEELTAISVALFDRIRDTALTAIHPGDSLDVLQLQFETATLRIVRLFRGTAIAEGAFKESGWDVIAGATITVTQNARRPYEWSASLWYTDLGRDKEYRWWEVLYMTSPGLQRREAYEPYALTDLARADKAASPGMNEYMLAAQPRPIDGENVDDFYERWADLLAKAYRGELEIPRFLPLS